MTREEAITELTIHLEHWERLKEEHIASKDESERTIKAIDMAIEALTEPKTIIGIDIPYGSDKGLATVFKGNEKMVLEEVKEIMSVVHCKDCRHYKSITDGYGVCTGRQTVLTTQRDDDFCSYGERREP